ncbi:MAG: metallophosphoesterase [Christensenellales bacterium]|jgi:3',5'-cyclic AMP phosphodiesterase CpdA
MKKKCFFIKVLKGIGTVLLSIAFAFVGLAFVLLVQPKQNLELVGAIQPVAHRDLEVAKDEDGYWTITKPDDSELVILQLTDIHIGNSLFTQGRDKLAIEAVTKIVNHVQPDLIIATGDIVYPINIQGGNGNNLASYKIFAGMMESFGIPWALTFGNHDSEFLSLYTKQELGEYLVTLEHCLFQPGPADINGVGNYVIKVLNSDGSLNNALVLMDSNAYEDYNPWHYDKIRDNQIVWYENTLKAISPSEEDLVPSLAFFHIPLNEFEDAWRLYKQDSDEVEYLFGAAREPDEKVCAPYTKGNMFDKMVELGSTKGVFVGHDHYNNWSIRYKGIELSYGYSIDYLAYSTAIKKVDQRGGTIIRIADDGSYYTEKKLLIDM